MVKIVYTFDSYFMIQEKILKKLYSNGSSMMEIAKKLGKSHHQVVYWMNKYHISRRSWNEATYIKRNPDGDPFKIKAKLSREEVFLKALGIGLFLGEGSKRFKFGIRLGNTDPLIINKFIEFLLKICGVNKNKLRFCLIIFNDSDPEKALRFWLKILKVKASQFGKIVIIPPQGKGTYKKKSKYGVLEVGCYNTKLRKWLDEQIGLL